MVPPCEWYRLVSQPKIAKKSTKPTILAFKVIEFSANRQSVYDFVLVTNSNLGPISNRYWDTVTYWPKIANFAHPLSFSTLVQGDPPSNLWKSFTVPETRVFPVADGEDLVILTCTALDWSTRVTDGRTDGQTDRRTDRQTDGQNCDG